MRAHSLAQLCCQALHAVESERIWLGVAYVSQAAGKGCRYLQRVVLNVCRLGRT